MIDRDHDLSISRQAKALGISRGSIYYLPQPTSEADLALMRRMDELHLEYPFAGSRMLRGLLGQEGHDVGRLHVATLMKRMGIEALYRRPNTSKPAPGHKIYPYLARGTWRWSGPIRSGPWTSPRYCRRIQAAAKAAKRVTRVLARGTPSSQLTTRVTFMAAAMQTCWRPVFASPM